MRESNECDLVSIDAVGGEAKGVACDRRHHADVGVDAVRRPSTGDSVGLQHSRMFDADQGSTGWWGWWSGGDGSVTGCGGRFGAGRGGGVGDVLEREHKECKRVCFTRHHSSCHNRKTGVCASALTSRCSAYASNCSKCDAHACPHFLLPQI